MIDDLHCGARPLAIITGPTASGKESVAHELALQMGCEIVSLDSMKIYREIEVATAKPAPERRSKVRYHLVDILEPHVDFSVGEYLPLVECTLQEIQGRGGVALLVGGTALYLKAYLEGLQTGGEADWDLRSRLMEEARGLGPEALHARLQAADPAAASKIHPRDLRRIVRALEVLEKTGRPPSEAWSWGAAPHARRQVPLFGLAWERRELYARIDRRVESMVAQGLFEEATRLSLRQPPLSRSASQAIGYKEILRGLDAGSPRGEIISRIALRTRRFAKSQMTWFRKFPIQWIPLATDFVPAEVAREILGRLAADGRGRG